MLRLSDMSWQRMGASKHVLILWQVGILRDNAPEYNPQSAPQQLITMNRCHVFDQDQCSLVSSIPFSCHANYPVIIRQFDTFLWSWRFSLIFLLRRIRRLFIRLFLVFVVIPVSVPESPSL